MVFLKRLFCCVLVVIVLKALPIESTLYFANQSTIDKLENNKVTAVIYVESSPLALDCNSCDDRIYWTIGKEIKRGFPNLPSSIESVISLGLHDPKGVAVDWRGNNVYFTDQLVSSGSVEVTSCDGKYRRVLLRDNEYLDAGPIAVDPLHGYIFFADVRCCIWRAEMDGKNAMKLINPTGVPKFEDIAVDHKNSVLYWTNNGNIYSSDLNGDNVTEHESGSSTPSGISVSDDVLYWTQKKAESTDGGAIYSFDLDSGGSISLVLQNESLDPLDMSSFVPKKIVDSVNNSGCSNNNGECEQFCFTVPNVENTMAVSTSYKCACHTGYKLNNDNSSCLNTPLKFLLIGQKNYIDILSFDVPGEEIPLPLPIVLTGVVDNFAYDAKNRLIYWTQRSPPAIWRSKLNGDDAEAIITESIAYPEGIVLDSVGDILFWADSTLDKIEVVDTGSFKRRVIIDTDLDHPRGLAINETLGFIYWTDTGLEPKVERASFDGFNRETLKSSQVFQPGPITNWKKTGQIFWGEGHPDYRAIWQASSEGTDNSILLSVDDLNHHVGGLTVLDNLLYWTDREEGGLHKIDLEESIGNANADPVAEDLGYIRGVSAVDAGAPVVENNCHTNQGQCEDICVPNVGGSHTCLCQQNYQLVDDMCVEDYPLMMLLTNGSVVIGKEDPRFFFGDIIRLPIPARKLDIDMMEQKLYWISSEDGLIYRGDITTPNNNTAYIHEPVITCCYDNITDIAVDWWGRNLYWTDGAAGVVGVAKLSGRSQQVLIDGLTNPSHVILDPYESNLYFVDGSTVYYVQLNGMGVPETIWTDSPEHPILDLTIDLTEHFLFWTYNACVYEYRILETGPPESIWCFDDHNQHPRQFRDFNPSLLRYYNDKVIMFLSDFDEFAELDEHTHEEMYYTSSFTITFDQIFGENIQDFVFRHFTIQPDTHWCTRTNGDCEGAEEALCLITDHYDRVCQCPPAEFIQVQYDEEREVCRYNCIGTDAFLLLSTDSQILYLPLRDPEFVNSDENSNHNCIDPPVLEPQRLPLGQFGDIRSISYDPLSEKVFWIDREKSTVNWGFLNGTQREILRTFDMIDPRSMVYDWNSGNIFWMETSDVQIDVLTFDGRGSGVMLEHNPNGPQFWLPNSLAVDSKNSILYWSNSTDRTLNKLSLNNPNYPSSVININRRVVIQYLTFEPRNNLLFWFDRLSDSIEMLNGKITKIVTDVVNATHVTAMASSTVQGHSILFWYNQSDWSVYYYNVTSGNVSVYNRLPEGTIITYMTGFDYEEFVYHNPLCLSSDEYCSDLCVPINETSSRCACPKYRELMDDNSNCTDLLCDNDFTCYDDSTCLPDLYLCDGIASCNDGSDEIQCNCSIGKVECSSVNMCYDLFEMCDEDPDCVPNGEDEDTTIGGICYCEGVRCVAKGSDVAIWECMPAEFKCDNTIDCLDKRDEENCAKTSSSSSSSTSSSVTTPSASPSVTPTLINTASPVYTITVVVASTASVILLLLSIVVAGLILQCIVTRKRKVVHHNFSSTSPQPSHIRSINTSDISLNTMETGSTHVEKTSQEARFIKRLSTLSTDPSNPPNSPITHRSVAFTLGDEMSMVSHPFSEFDPPVPRVPNPSVNYDAISDRMSSVSQRRFPGVLPQNGIVGHHGVHDQFNHNPPPPYFREDVNHQIMYLDNGSEAYEEYCPPINPATLYHLNRLHNNNLDNISETTFSMTTYNEIPPDHEFENYLPNSETIHEDEDQGDGPMPHPYYDCPPPPSPVTEYSIHGD